MNETPRHGGSQIVTVPAASWAVQAAELKHIYLVGDFRRPVPHPFLRRQDVEVIACVYAAGDHGIPHWHAEVDEIEIVLEGTLAYREIATRKMHRFETGDLLNIPHGICVERVIDSPARTLAIKLPSRDEKVTCRHCDRSCSSRRKEYQPI